MPLTTFQQGLLATLSQLPSRGGYLAGGAALHFAPNSTRFSNDLDFFHDSVELVASTFAADRAHLEEGAYEIRVEISQPGFVRARVRRHGDETLIDWAHDSAWRFMPLVTDATGVLLLHPIDLAINKVLALAGRDEPRDFVDTLFVHARILRLGALCWAAVGKDPGFTPRSLLELLKRHGRYRPEDFARLNLSEPFDLVDAKVTWLAALHEAESFVTTQKPDEIGCLYWSYSKKTFVMPSPSGMLTEHVQRHWGAPGGILPQIVDDGGR